MIHYDEIEELACLMLGWDYDSVIDNDLQETLYEEFYSEYSITLEEFQHLLNDLVKFTPSWKSPLTDKLYQGFVVQEGNNGLMRAIIKEEV